MQRIHALRKCQRCSIEHEVGAYGTTDFECQLLIEVAGLPEGVLHVVPGGADAGPHHCPSYSDEDINTAALDSETGTTIKPVLRLM